MAASKRLLLDRRTLLFAAEMALEYDKCALCGEPLTNAEAHRLHPKWIGSQKAVQTAVAIEIRQLAATAADLKGRRLPWYRA